VRLAQCGERIKPERGDQREVDIESLAPSHFEVHAERCRADQHHASLGPCA